MLGYKFLLPPPCDQCPCVLSPPGTVRTSAGPDEAPESKSASSAAQPAKTVPWAWLHRVNYSPPMVTSTAETRPVPGSDSSWRPTFRSRFPSLLFLMENPTHQKSCSWLFATCPPPDGSSFDLWPPLMGSHLRTETASKRWGHIWQQNTWGNQYRPSVGNRLQSHRKVTNNR